MEITILNAQKSKPWSSTPDKTHGWSRYCLLTSSTSPALTALTNSTQLRQFADTANTASKRSLRDSWFSEFVATSKAVFPALLRRLRNARSAWTSNKNVITSGWPTARCKTVLPRNPQYKYDVENVFVDVWMCWCLIPRFSIVSKIRQISPTHVDKRDDANFIKQLKRKSYYLYFIFKFFNNYYWINNYI